MTEFPEELRHPVANRCRQPSTCVIRAAGHDIVQGEWNQTLNDMYEFMKARIGKQGWVIKRGVVYFNHVPVTYLIAATMQVVVKPNLED